MKVKSTIFAIAALGILVTSCSPQSIDEHTTQDNIQGFESDTNTGDTDTDIDKGDIKIPTHG